MPKNLPLQINAGYKTSLQDVKNKIKTACLQAALSVNQQLIQFYCLKRNFSDTQGFFRGNLHSARKFVEAYDSHQIVQAPPGQVPWTRNLALLERLNYPKESELKTNFIGLSRQKKKKAWRTEL